MSKKEETKLDQKTRDAHEEFLIEIPILLEDLQELLRQSKYSQDIKVNFSDTSLDHIERFYLDVLENKEKINVSLARFNRIITAYFGEALIERVGGKWALNEASDDTSFGTPVIIEWAKGDCMAFSTVERRETLSQDHKPFLREFIAYAANKEKFEQDFFKEFE